MSNARVLSKVGRVAFHAYGSGSQLFSAGSVQTTIIQLNTQLSFAGKVGGFNTSTYQFTAPTDGLYLFTAKISQSSTSSGPAAYIFKNGVLQLELVLNYGVANLSSSGTVLLPLAANDVIDLRGINYNSVAVTLDLARCSLTGALIG